MNYQYAVYRKDGLLHVRTLTIMKAARLAKLIGGTYRPETYQGGH